MKPELETILKTAVDEAKNVMQGCLDEGGNMPPALLICSSGKVAALDIRALMSGDSGKDILAMVMRQMVQRPEVDLLVMCSEAWVLMGKATGESEEDAKAQIKKLMKDLEGSIANHPDKTESLICLAMSKWDDVFISFPIDRKAKTLGEEMRKEKISGRFTDNKNDRPAGGTLH